MDEYRSNLIPLNQIKCYQPHESSSLKINRFPPAQIKTLSLLQFRRNETFEQFSSENVLNSLNKYEKKRKIYGQIVHTYLEMTSNTISWNGKLEIQHCKSNKPCCLRAIFTLVLAYPCCIEWWQINYSRCMVCFNSEFPLCFQTRNPSNLFLNLIHWKCNSTLCTKELYGWAQLLLTCTDC